MKKFWKLTAVLLSVVFLAGLVSGCAGKQQAQEAPKAEEQKQLTIGLALSTLNNPFFVDMKDGAQAAADKIGAKLVVMDAQDDASKQVSQVEDLIQQKVDVILLNPTDSDGLVTAVKDANKANIPVITLDRSVNGGTVVSHIASDNVAGGKMAADFIVEQLKGKGKVVELEGIAGTSAARDRGQGFHEVMDKQTDIKVVAKQPADFDRSKGMSVMENILQSQPEINAVFAHNDEMALGALQAIEAAKKQILVVGFDGNDDAVKAVNDGKMAATVAQQPKLIGELGVQVAEKVKKGEKVEAQIPAELKLITKQ
ncbi:ribose ABC transporter substrate-binding protein RbsB [Desulforamulus hydrothermalis]|uniref:Putative sugar transporter subunit: periplasmic-binding component of ABC superfamily n=1 Tax=Desulforamulus hydrothermalis Lam5 = DSM 18033 TaxID=1121428 RepID=K8DYQ2_9FIRM|nr:ribose ABC transporter substrate-binding protein RbsB [Desulforamulus hydrothermalis]CCO07910.1 putative sugar transporter subunit: periplasmic-binding component of ABC superfamily [Desulforamulus hydrothermalis Lam5 = DSM 18033]SHH34765.1 ribose-binding protein [Desulforamulus hydrothermalis Lam5 = DSM 18033]